MERAFLRSSHAFKEKEVALESYLAVENQVAKEAGKFKTMRALLGQMG